ncbi:SpoIIE family protein phosphatase [Streptomyces sp. NBC_01264]|uniref:SpoIIE family protein phosphatase n=1 Tax=Streptomyces sp. NBC_01264 TaxID=2903804 RepID=UPI0022534CCE|nr:SpoIIE family protein phosphatase [Streptomyces sp. NBC_01264]MCX4782235.1 SpoIIE family protein phosphatase [Streptomyces sp. NBC_01264]
MNRFARLATRLLAVPGALVWMAGDDSAPVESWPAGSADAEATALCRRVAELGEPLALIGDGDARLAFAGVPLAGPAGELLGVLAATDTGPRTWSEEDLRDLGDLAAACSAHMRLRLRAEEVQRAGEAAEEAASLAEAQADRMETLLNRAQLLLRAAEDLGDTSGLDEVCARVSDLAGSDLKPSHVGLVLMGEDGLLRQVAGSESGQAPRTGPEAGYGVDSDRPGARAVRERRTVVVTDRRTPAGFRPAAVDGLDGSGLHTLVCVPLSGAESVLGVLELGWDIPHVVDAAERAVLVVLADYTARAVERAAYLDARVSIAVGLQQAMLTDLVQVPGLETAALYRPAARQDMVGGDWYDLYPLPGPHGAWAMTVGDITGHDLRAATLMGQVRSMLRQADIDHPGRPPHQAVEALVQACQTLGLPAGGTLVHAHLTPRPGGHWQFSWTNAGHPPPLLAHRDTPGEPAEQLRSHDALLHPALPPGPRTTHTRLLTPGSTLLLYTDGLVEHRGQDLDAAPNEAARRLAAVSADSPLDDVLRHLAGTVAPAHPDDDTVLLAIRVAPLLPVR